MFFFQAEDGIRDLVRSRGLGDVYKRQNLNWNIFQHKTDKSLIDTDVPFADDYEVKYLALSLGESTGMINRKRHQRNGYSVSAGYGVGIGLDKNSPFYQSFGLNAIYYKLFNPVMEFSAGYSTGYTTSTKPSLITYLGSGNIKGCLLYTSDAADERSSVDLGGRRIIKKKKPIYN